MECARVYKLNSTNGLVYYGSTTQKVLTKRLAKHKSSAKIDGARCRSYLLFTEGDTVTITLVENVDNCKDKYELQARERWYIENHPCVNKQIPNRTTREWYQANKEQHNKYYKEYRVEHREKLKELASQIIKCECGCDISRANIAIHRKSQKHQNKMLQLSNVVDTSDTGDICPLINLCGEVRGVL